VANQDHVADACGERAASTFARMTRIAKPNALRHMARVATLRGETKRAQRLLHKSIRAAVRLHIPYEEALSHLQLAQAASNIDDKRASLNLAEQHFLRLGCKRHLEQINLLRGT
jgi:hypothetical protein